MDKEAGHDRLSFIDYVELCKIAVINLNFTLYLVIYFCILTLISLLVPRHKFCSLY